MSAIINDLEATIHNLKDIESKLINKINKKERKPLESLEDNDVRIVNLKIKLASMKYAIEELNTKLDFLLNIKNNLLDKTKRDCNGMYSRVVLDALTNVYTDFKDSGLTTPLEIGILYYKEDDGYISIGMIYNTRGTDMVEFYTSDRSDVAVEAYLSRYISNEPQKLSSYSAIFGVNRY